MSVFRADPLAITVDRITAESRLSTPPPSSKQVRKSVESIPSPPPSGDAGACLAALLDLRGAVQLSQQLTLLQRSKHLSVSSESVADADDIRIYVTRRAESLQEKIARSFSQALTSRSQLPLAEQACEILSESGILESRRKAILIGAISALSFPFGNFVANRLDQVRGEMRELRQELTESLRSLGPHAARMERLDSALAEATRRRSGDLIARILPALDDSFARGMRDSLMNLPTKEELARSHLPALVATWYAPRGFIHAYIDRSRRTVLGIFQHHRRLLDALVQSVSVR